MRDYSTIVPRICVHCGKAFEAYVSEVRAGRRLYCSRECYLLRPRPSLEERFWKKVDTAGECWIWKGGATKDGYGCFGITPGKNVLAHRYSYELAYGPIPDNLFVCHNCPSGDNPSCVNPAHLFLGTAQDNVNDMWDKGRGLSGDRHWTRKRKMRREED